MKMFTLIALFSLLSLTSKAAEYECVGRDGHAVEATKIDFDKVVNSKSFKPQVFVKGVVVQLLPEDQNGRPHQKYIIQAFGNKKVVIVSNLEFGRIPLKEGSSVEVCGEYINAQGGMVHWTHFDPHGGHPDGFTIHEGKLYGDKEI